MAQQNNAIPGSGSGNTYVDSLLWGCGWNLFDGPVTVHFGAGPIPDIPGQVGVAWTANEIAAFAGILQTYENVCGLSFEIVTTYGQADMVEWKLHQDAFSPNVLASHEIPNGAYPQIYGYYNVDTSYWGNFNPGSDAYFVLLHELGHAMGLAHPQDGGSEADATLFPGVTSDFDTGDYELNQGIWTVMSYVRGWNGAPPPGGLAYGEASTPMAFDVAALQFMYGVNASYNLGNDTYVLPTANALGTSWVCIWDAGGDDTISNDGSTLACSIDLNYAPLVGPNAAGFVSHITGGPAGGIRGGFTIANGAVIENAIGGEGADTLIGNEFGNVLRGGTGGDAAWGGVGNDAIYGGSSAGDPTDAGDTLYGDAGNDTIYGNGGDDEIYGGAGGDAIYAGQDSDTIYGGSSAGDPTDAGDLIHGNKGDDTIYGNGGNDELHGGSEADRLYGGKDNDRLFGDEGNDFLDGGVGADELTGGSGDDTFVFKKGQADGCTVFDFAGNGAAPGDFLLFQGYDAGATFTESSSGLWAITDGASVELITFANAPTIHQSDYLFV